MDEAKKVRAQIAAGFTLPAVIMVLFGVLSYRAIHRFTAARTWASHTAEVRVEIGELLDTLVGAESGQRGFALTGDEGFLQPYRLAMTLINKRYERLRTITADNPQQQQRLQALRPLLDTKLAYMQRAVDVRRQKTTTPSVPAPAPTTIFDDSGRLMMSDLHDALTEMDASEQALLRAREQNMTEASLALVNTLLLGMVCSVLTSFLIGLCLVRRIAQLTRIFVLKVEQLYTELGSSAAQQLELAEQAEAKRDAAAHETARILATAEHLSQQASEVLARVREISTAIESLRPSSGGAEELAAAAQHAERGALSLDLGAVDLRRLLGRIHELDSELAELLRESVSVQVAADRPRMALASLLFQLGSEPRAHAGARASAIRSSVRASRVRSGGVRPVRPSSRPEVNAPGHQGAGP
ncbi:MAG: CHASE3 domain-containing protein [Polyangia bacterium]